MTAHNNEQDRPHDNLDDMTPEAVIEGEPSTPITEQQQSSKTWWIVAIIILIVGYYGLQQQGMLSQLNTFFNALS